MVYTVFYKTSSFVGYCFLSRYSIHPQRHDVFSFMLFEATLVKFQICSFIVLYILQTGYLYWMPFLYISIYLNFIEFHKCFIPPANNGWEHTGQDTVILFFYFGLYIISKYNKVCIYSEDR